MSEEKKKPRGEVIRYSPEFLMKFAEVGVDVGVCVWMWVCVLTGCVRVDYCAGFVLGGVGNGDDDHPNHRNNDSLD